MKERKAIDLSGQQYPVGGESKRNLFIMKVIFSVIILSLLIINAASAGPADVVNVEVKPDGAHSFHFSVSVRHNDEGWDHFANKWDVVAPDGTILATRILHHPHENEQPFARSLGGVMIPDDITTVTVQAHDSVHGYGGKIITIRLSR